MIDFDIRGNRVFKIEDGKADVITGTIVDDVYQCERDANEHLHFIHNGWGIDIRFLNELISRGVKICHIHDKFFNEDFYSELDMIKVFGIEEEYGEHGKQYILPKKYWGLEPDYLKDSRGFVQLHVHTMYCLAPETIIYNCRRHHNREGLYRDDYTRIKKSKTIKYLFDNWYKGKGSTFRYQVKVFDDERFIPSLIKNIKKSELKQLFKITTSSGKSIEASREHKFLTNEGWMRLKDISLINKIGCNEIKFINDKNIPKEEKQEFYRLARKFKFNKCSRCSSMKDLDIHHKDLNIKNNNPDNLETLCSGCHTEEHYKNLREIRYEKVVSIEKTRISETYDIEVEHKSHNFVANGFITHNSMLDGFGHVEELALKARRMKMNALAITDHGNLFGIYKFHKVCKKIGIKPILGCEFYMTGWMGEKVDRQRRHLILLAKNEVGYKNLLKLSTLSHLNGFYYRPRIDKETLDKYKEGLICSSACMAGYPLHALIEGYGEEKALEEMNWFKERFGDDYYIEIMPDLLPEYMTYNHVLVKLARQAGIKIVATNDVHFVNASDKEAHDVLLGIQKKASLAENPGFESHLYYLQSKDEIKHHFEKYHPQVSFQDYEDAISRTQEIADKVEIFDIKGAHALPKMQKEPNDFFKLFREILEDETDEEKIKRISYEVNTIHNLGFEDYFLLIADIVKWAKSKGIQVGSRGSVAGSMVAYLMGITDVDSMKHDLIFERFLNPGRKSPPDIDIDFDASKRELVLEYINSRWKTAKISTYVAIQGKGSVKDVCRVYGIPYGIAEVISKAFTTRQTLNMTLDRAILTEPIISQFYGKYPQMFKIARRLEGRIKTKGIHPAGVIISDVEISDIVALRMSKGSSGEVVIQCDMEDADALGLLKVDCLSSKTQTTLSIAKEAVGIKDFSEIPLDDEKVYRAFSRGNCWDIFQFQSELGRETVMKVKPKNFEDLSAITALIRPGAYDFIDDFANDNYEPLMEELRPILKSTRNIILYQEQAMRISVDIAGFSLKQADDLRKAIGKKLTENMSRLRGVFIKGGVSKGHSQEVMAQLFKIIERSSSYSFNHSHAVAYTLSSYWSMWLKVYHPVEWAVAELTVQVGDEEKLKRYLNDAINNGIKIVPPHINKSDWGFKKDGDSVRCGLGMVKQFSENGYKELAEKRPYQDFFDFMNRISGVKINRGAVQSLIKAGAFDGFGKGRKAYCEFVEGFKRTKGKAVQEPLLWPQGEWTKLQRSRYEKEAVGFYISGHPIQHFKAQIEPYGIDITTGEGETDSKVTVKVVGVVDNIKKWDAKNGEMAFVDLTGVSQYSVSFWNQSWSTYKGHFKVGDTVIIFGRKLDGRFKLALDTVKGDSMVVLKDPDE